MQGHLSVIQTGHWWISLFAKATGHFYRTERAGNNQNGHLYRVESICPEVVLNSAEQTNYYYYYHFNLAGIVVHFTG